VAVPDYVRAIRARIGHDLLFMPGVIAVIFNDAGQTLVQRRSDNGLWSLIGGILEPGEEPAPAIVREVREEAGIVVVPERIVGVYAEPDGIVYYPNGDVMQFLSVIFACRHESGVPRVNDEESLEVRYFAPDALPDMDPRHRRYLDQALRGDPLTHFNRE
jgi:8-oxo-dGTP pyrophosphatase MutT (NUDIX family)